MSEKTEITFMQTRLIRLASEEWHLPVEQIIHLFKEADVLGYIEKCSHHRVQRTHFPRVARGAYHQAAQVAV